MLSFATAGLASVARYATLPRMAEFRALDLWQKAETKTDADVARAIGVGKSVFSRFRNGLQTLKMRDLLKLEAVTGITPAECAEFYARAVKERTPEPEGEAGKKKAAKRPFDAKTVEAA